MNFRLTAILFAAVLALVVGLLIYALTAPDPAAATEGPFAALTSAGVKPEDVTGLEIARTSPRDEKLVFEKKDGKWRLTAPAQAGVDSTAVDALVRDLLALKPTEYGGPIERANTGLTRPGITVTLTAGDKSAGVHVGNTTVGSDQAVTFLVSAADPNIKPMAVPTRTLRSLFRPDAKDGEAAVLVKWRSDFRPRTLITADVRDPESDITTAMLSQGSRTLALARTGGEWRFTEPAAFGRADVSGASEPDATRFTGVRPLLNAVLFLQTTGPADVTEDVPAGDLTRYGLADADAPLRVQFTPKDKGTQTLLIGKRVTDKDGKPVVPTRHYVKLAGDAAVFTVTTADTVDKLLATLADPAVLRNRDLLPPNKLADYDAIDSTAGGGFKLRKLVGGTDPWGLYGGGGEPAEAQAQAVQAMLTKLAAPRVASDVLAKPDDEAFAGANLLAELKVWANGVAKDKAKLSDGKLPPEPPVTGEPITLRIGRRFTKKIPRPDGTTEDRSMAIVRRIAGTESTDLEVPFDAVSAAVQPRVKFLNARPPQFVPGQATGLVLFREGKRTEYVKNPTATDPAYPQGVWNVGDAKGPVADTGAILDVLNRLAMLQASLLMEKADDPKALGLDPANPKMSATVTLPGDKGTPRTEGFHFGEPVKGDDKSVYFKAVDKPFVYSVPVEVADRVRTADLSDKVAFRIDPARVKEMSLRGWANTTADKSQVTVKAELNNGVWVATEPKGATLDTVAMIGLLEALRNPKSVGPRPDGKDPAALGIGADGVNLLVVSKAAKEGEADVGLPVKLGALTADKTGVYAQVGPDAFYVLDARPFAPLLLKPPLTRK